MKSTMQNTEALNDLIEINNDRVAGYNKAAVQTSDEDLRSLFAKFAAQSGQFAGELRQRVMAEGDVPEEGTTIRGKIYRAWMGVKATFSGKDRKSVLESCEFGEDAAQRAYESALEEDDLSNDVRQLLEQQKATLREAHDKVKKLRDAQV